MKRRAWLARGLLPVASYLIAGCTVPKSDNLNKQQNYQFWSGRLSLTLVSEPPRSFFASFELKGNASDGELTLTSPLGSILAAMRWAPGEASLRTGKETQLFDSMESLTGHVTGTSLPVRTLFDWLGGVNTTGAGWQADLSRLDQGRLVATRTEPAPAAELKLILDR